MAKAYYEGDSEQWVDFKEPMPPIAVGVLRQIGSAKTVLFGDDSIKLMTWIVSGISEWHLSDADGVLMVDAPSIENLLRLAYPVVDWISGEAIRSAVELPLRFSTASPNGSIPALEAASTS